MKKVQLVPWGLFEKLCLVTSMRKLKNTVADNNWSAISRHTKHLFEAVVPPSECEKLTDDWFSLRQCSAQYEALIKGTGPRKKKRGERHFDNTELLETLEVGLARDLGKQLGVKQIKVREMYEDTLRVIDRIDHDAFKEDELDEFLDCIDGGDLKTKVVALLKEKFAKMENSSKPAITTDCSTLPAEAKTCSTTSPLLTSLLQSPSPLRTSLPSTSSSTISVLLNSSPSIPISDSALSKLLEAPTNTPSTSSALKMLSLPSTSGCQKNTRSSIIEKNDIIEEIVIEDDEVPEQVHAEKIIDLEAEDSVLKFGEISKTVNEMLQVANIQTAGTTIEQVDLTKEDTITIESDTETIDLEQSSDDDSVEVIVLNPSQNMVAKRNIQTAGTTIEQVDLTKEDTIAIESDTETIDLEQSSDDDSVEVIVLNPSQNMDEAKQILDNDSVIIHGQPVQITNETVVINDSSLNITGETVLIGDSGVRINRINEDAVVIEDPSLKISSNAVVPVNITDNTVIIDDSTNAVILDESSVKIDEGTVIVSNADMQLDDGTVIMDGSEINIANNIHLQESQSGAIVLQEAPLEISSDTVILDEKSNRFTIVRGRTNELQYNNETLLLSELDVESESANALIINACNTPVLEEIPLESLSELDISNLTINTDTTNKVQPGISDKTGHYYKQIENKTKKTSDFPQDIANIPITVEIEGTSYEIKDSGDFVKVSDAYENERSFHNVEIQNESFHDEEAIETGETYYRITSENILEKVCTTNPKKELIPEKDPEKSKNERGKQQITDIERGRDGFKSFFEDNTEQNEKQVTGEVNIGINEGKEQKRNHTESEIDILDDIEVFVSERIDSKQSNVLSENVNEKKEEIIQDLKGNEDMRAIQLEEEIKSGQETISEEKGIEVELAQTEEIKEAEEKALNEAVENVYCIYNAAECKAMIEAEAMIREEAVIEVAEAGSVKHITERDRGADSKYRGDAVAQVRKEDDEKSQTLFETMAKEESEKAREVAETPAREITESRATKEIEGNLREIGQSEGMKMEAKTKEDRKSEVKTKEEETLKFQRSEEITQEDFEMFEAKGSQNQTRTILINESQTRQAKISAEDAEALEIVNKEEDVTTKEKEVVLTDCSPILNIQGEDNLNKEYEVINKTIETEAAKVNDERESIDEEKAKTVDHHKPPFILESEAVVLYKDKIKAATILKENEAARTTTHSNAQEDGSLENEVYDRNIPNEMKEARAVKDVKENEIDEAMVARINQVCTEELEIEQVSVNREGAEREEKSSSEAIMREEAELIKLFDKEEAKENKGTEVNEKEVRIQDYLKMEEHRSIEKMNATEEALATDKAKSIGVQEEYKADTQAAKQQNVENQKEKAKAEESKVEKHSDAATKTEEKNAKDEALVSEEAKSNEVTNKEVEVSSKDDVQEHSEVQGDYEARPSGSGTTPKDVVIEHVEVQEEYKAEAAKVAKSKQNPVTKVYSNEANAFAEQFRAQVIKEHIPEEREKVINIIKQQHEDMHSTGTQNYVDKICLVNIPKLDLSSIKQVVNTKMIEELERAAKQSQEISVAVEAFVKAACNIVVNGPPREGQGKSEAKASGSGINSRNDEHVEVHTKYKAIPRGSRKSSKDGNDEHVEVHTKYKAVPRGSRKSSKDGNDEHVEVHTKYKAIPTGSRKSSKDSSVLHLEEEDIEKRLRARFSKELSPEQEERIIRRLKTDQEEMRASGIYPTIDKLCVVEIPKLTDFDLSLLHKPRDEPTKKDEPTNKDEPIKKDEPRKRKLSKSKEEKVVQVEAKKKRIAKPKEDSKKEPLGTQPKPKAARTRKKELKPKGILKKERKKKDNPKLKTDVNEDDDDDIKEFRAKLRKEFSPEDQEKIIKIWKKQSEEMRLAGQVPASNKVCIVNIPKLSDSEVEEYTGQPSTSYAPPMRPQTAKRGKPFPKKEASENGDFLITRKMIDATSSSSETSSDSDLHRSSSDEESSGLLSELESRVKLPKVAKRNIQTAGTTIEQVDLTKEDTITIESDTEAIDLEQSSDDDSGEVIVLNPSQNMQGSKGNSGRNSKERRSTSSTTRSKRHKDTSADSCPDTSPDRSTVRKLRGRKAKESKSTTLTSCSKGPQNTSADSSPDSSPDRSSARKPRGRKADHSKNSEVKRSTSLNAHSKGNQNTSAESCPDSSPDRSTIRKPRGRKADPSQNPERNRSTSLSTRSKGNQNTSAESSPASSPDRTSGRKQRGRKADLSQNSKESKSRNSTTRSKGNTSAESCPDSSPDRSTIRKPRGRKADLSRNSKGSRSARLTKRSKGHGHKSAVSSPDSSPDRSTIRKPRGRKAGLSRNSKESRSTSSSNRIKGQRGTSPESSPESSPDRSTLRKQDTGSSILKEDVITINGEKTDDESSTKKVGRKPRLMKTVVTPKVPKKRGRKRKLPSLSSPNENPAETLLKKTIMEAFNRLAAHKHASIFTKPAANIDSAKFIQLVRRPMDLATIKAKIEKGSIHTTHQLHRDAMLMIQNFVFFCKLNSPEFTKLDEIKKYLAAEMEILEQALGGGGGAPPSGPQLDEKVMARSCSSKDTNEEPPKKQKFSHFSDESKASKRARLSSP